MTVEKPSPELAGLLDALPEPPMSPELEQAVLLRVNATLGLDLPVAPPTSPALSILRVRLGMAGLVTGLTLGGVIGFAIGRNGAPSPRLAEPPQIAFVTRAEPSRGRLRQRRCQTLQRTSRSLQLRPFVPSPSRLMPACRRELSNRVKQTSDSC